MATSLEKRISELELAAGISDEHRVLILRSDSDTVPDGFAGTVIRLRFVAPKPIVETEPDAPTPQPD